MTYIVERLQYYTPYGPITDMQADALMKEAANEIERLRDLAFENSGMNAVERLCFDKVAKDNERLREVLRGFIGAVDWCLENDPDRMSEAVFDAAVKARAALEGKE